MSKSISGSRARVELTWKCLSRLVLAAIAHSGFASADAAEGPVSRWSSANPPTPAAVNVLPPVQVASKSPPAPADIPGQSSAELRRLPPIEDTPPEAELETSPPQQPAQSEPAPQAEPAASPEPSEIRQSNALPEARSAEPVDWSTPQVVVGPERTTRAVSHEEMISTPPEADPRASRFSRIAGVESKAGPSQDQLQDQGRSPVAAAPASRYSEPPPASLQPVSPLRQPVFARVFDEMETAEGAEERSARDATLDQRPLPDVYERLSPIFACRLLGLPATQERTSASKPSEGTTTR